MKDKKLLKVGISMGDINGIGPEVIIKALSSHEIFASSIPIIYGSGKVLSYHKKTLDNSDFNFLSIKSAAEAKPKKINLVSCWKEEVNIALGEKNENGGKYALKSLEAATKDLVEGKIDTLVTAPINKDCVRDAGFEFPGHTEYLAHHSKADDVLMFMVSNGLRIGVVTGHIPLREVASKITPEAIEKKLNLMLTSLKRDFLIKKPRIAVLGLNPHAGDRGTLGSEEINIINPVIQKYRDKGELIYGSYSSDGFFGSSNLKHFDAVLAMYHDQGLVGFKSISFDEGVNFTAGLPIVRTSPDHGTAYDIAGRNKASERSFRNAYFAACDIYRNRKQYDEMHSNPLEKQKTK
ncbi:MAG: 4-hydroxythreonine-4-phosphate dehydrogenase PdxA [Crocinitomicaceae bacterium]|nr:4-hydroxythreonine-4-phosphate dehydrogenase PdxA [Crocinitomicaceae bacterium]